MYFRIFFLIGLTALMSITIVFAGIPYDLIETIQLDAHVNIEESKQAYFAYAIFLDESCTKELIGAINFGTIQKSHESDLIHLYIKNTGLMKWTLSDIRTDVKGFKILWECNESTTIGSGEILHVWIQLKIDPDVSPTYYDFNLLMDIADLSAQYRSRYTYTSKA